MEIKFLPSQQRMMHIPHQEKTDFCLYQGGVGSGKSQGGAWLGCIIALMFPGSRGLVGTRFYPLLKDTTQRKYFDLIESHYPNSVLKSIRSTGVSEIHFKNGSVILFRALDNWGRVQGDDFNWIHIDEAAQFKTNETFIHLVDRLRSGPVYSADGSELTNRIFMTGNPEETPGWIYDLFIDEKNERANYRYIIAPTTENPYLPDSYVKNLKHVYSQEQYKVYVLGQTGRITDGKVYKQYGPWNIAKSDVCKYRSGDDLHISFDFNHHFMTCVIGQIQRKIQLRNIDGNSSGVIGDVLSIIDDVGVEYATIDELCTETLKIVDGYNHTGRILIHGDRTGHNKNYYQYQTAYETIRARFKSHFLGKNVEIKIIVSNRDGGKPRYKLQNRIPNVNACLLSYAKDVRIYIAEHCKYLQNSLDKTMYANNGTYEKEKIHDSKDPRSKIDHHSDCLDYLVSKELNLNRIKPKVY